MADPGISKPGARSRLGRILRSWVCFEAPSDIPYVFVVRVVNKNTYIKKIFYIDLLVILKSKYMCVISANLYKKYPPIFFKRGGGAFGMD